MSRGRRGSSRLQGPISLLRQRRELVPALVLALALGVMFVPLFGGTGSIAELRGDVVEQRRTYNRAGMLMLQNQLAAYHGGVSPNSMANPVELPEIDPRLWQVGRFSGVLHSELNQIENAIQAVHRLAARPEFGLGPASVVWTADEIESWTATVQELDLRFGSLLEQLAEIESARNRAYISIGLFGTLLAGLFVVLYLRQAVKLEIAAHDQLYLRRMALLTYKVQEDERRALARDLHDGTAQELAIARMATDKVSDEKTRRVIEASLTRAIDEIRFLARRLRPMPESHDTPAEMIRELCQYFESRYNFSFEFHLDRRIRLDWGQDAVVHLYRIVQESLSNIVRHADASVVQVTLQELDASRIGLTIQDNGVGLHDAQDGFGTAGMRERAELLCATFSRYSPPNGGTVVQLEFPTDLEHCR